MKAAKTRHAPEAPGDGTPPHWSTDGTLQVVLRENGQLRLTWEAALDAVCRSALAGSPYPLVLLDARMPGEDGLTVAMRIRQRPDLSATRIILLSSGELTGDENWLRELNLELERRVESALRHGRGGLLLRAARVGLLAASVLDLLPGVAELQEEADPDPGATKPRDRDRRLVLLCPAPVRGYDLGA